MPSRPSFPVVVSVNVQFPIKKYRPIPGRTFPEAKTWELLHLISRNGRLKGFNTDIDGFLYLLQNPASFCQEKRFVYWEPEERPGQSLALAARRSPGHF